jgi:hypothetical protein
MFMERINTTRVIKSIRKGWEGCVARKLLFLLLLFILTANVFVPGGIGTAIRHNTQNNTPHSNKTQHSKLQKQ